MQQFYTVLVQQIARVDASDDRQRQAVYDRARLNLARLIGNAAPDVSRMQNAALEQAITRLESEIEHIQAGQTARSERESLLKEARCAKPPIAAHGPEQPDTFAPPGDMDDANRRPSQSNDAAFVQPDEDRTDRAPPARSSQSQTRQRPPRGSDQRGAALAVTRTRMPPRLGRDPQHLLRAKSIGSPTVFVLLGASGVVALIGLIALVFALDAAVTGADPGQRPIVLFSPTRPTQFQVPRGNSYLRIPDDNGGVHLSSRIADVSTGPNSAAIAVRIAPVATDVLQGNRAEIRVQARQVSDRPSQTFAIAYRTSTGPNSGWFEFQPTPEFSEYSFRYTVPVAQRDDIVHDILIWADTAAQGGTIEVRSITITMGG